MHVTEQSGPAGYAPFSPSALAEQSFFFNADPTIVAAATAKMVRDPCGDQTSFMPAITADLAHVGEITVPILFVIGDRTRCSRRRGPHSRSPATPPARRSRLR